MNNYYKIPNAILKSWLYRNDGIRTSFVVGIVTFVICFILPFVFFTGFLVMKVMRAKGNLKQMTKVTTPTTKIISDTVVPVESRALLQLRSQVGVTVLFIILQPPLKIYVLKQPQEKQACHSHDNATPLSFRLRVTQDYF